MNAPDQADDTWLRCTAFEELMLRQDSYQYPCVICVRLQLSKSPEPSRWQHALDQVAQRHPLLRARLVRRASKLWWNILPASEIRLNFHSASAPEWPPLVRFDLEAAGGCQADLYHHSSAEADPACVLFLQIHHALADGLGCLAIVQDLFQYLTAVNALMPSAPVSASVLEQRNSFGLNWRRKLQLVPSQLIGLAGVRQFLMRRPVSLIEETHVNLESRSVPDQPITACSVELSRESVARLKEIARRRRVSMNDMMAAIMFEAVNHFRASAGGQARQWLRMMIPISLRDRETSKLPACNIVTCIFLDRTGAQIADRERLIASVHDEMELIKRHRLGLIFIASIWINKQLARWRGPVTAQRVRWPARCQTSCVFSNMGRILRGGVPLDRQGRLSADQLVLESIRIIAPIAPRMQAAVTVIQYASVLTLSMRYDSVALSAEQAAGILSDFAQRLESLPMPPEVASSPQAD